MAETLWASVQRLAPLQPDFVSVTYGAGGSTRERTHATVKRILDETALQPASHLTCVAATKDETDDNPPPVTGPWACGISWPCAVIPVTGIGTKFEAHPEGYQGSPETRGRHQGDRRFPRGRFGIPGKAPGEPEP